MTDNSHHPDLLAYLHGQLGPEANTDAEAHFDNCRQCQMEMKDLQDTLEILDHVAKRVEKAFPDPRQLEAVLDSTFGTGPPAPPGEEQELILAKDEIVSSLPSALRRRLSEGQSGSVADKLRKTLEVFTGLGKDALEKTMERILSAAPDALPAAAIRDNATQESGDVTATGEEGESAGGETKGE